MFCTLNEKLIIVRRKRERVTLPNKQKASQFEEREERNRNKVKKDRVERRESICEVV